MIVRLRNYHTAAYTPTNLPQSTKEVHEFPYERTLRLDDRFKFALSNSLKSRQFFLVSTPLSHVRSNTPSSHYDIPTIRRLSSAHFPIPSPREFRLADPFLDISPRPLRSPSHPLSLPPSSLFPPPSPLTPGNPPSTPPRITHYTPSRPHTSNLTFPNPSPR